MHLRDTLIEISLWHIWFTDYQNRKWYKSNHWVFSKFAKRYCDVGQQHSILFASLSIEWSPCWRYILQRWGQYIQGLYWAHNTITCQAITLHIQSQVPIHQTCQEQFKPTSWIVLLAPLKETNFTQVQRWTSYQLVMYSTTVHKW